MTTLLQPRTRGAPEILLYYTGLQTANRHPCQYQSRPTPEGVGYGVLHEIYRELRGRSYTRQ